MNMHIKYDRGIKSWIAFLTDSKGQRLGNKEYGITKEAVAFRLGIEYGRNPSKFAQPLSELVGEPLTQPVN